MPYGLHYAYYAGEDEALADNEQNELEAFAYREWQAAQIDGERFDD